MTESKFLQRLHEEDDGNLYYTATFSFGKQYAEDPEGSREGEFTVQVPEEVRDLSDENLDLYLRGFDLQERPAAKAEHPNYAGRKSETLSEEEKEKRKEEFAQKMSHRHEVGSAIEEVEEDLDRKLTPDEIKEMLGG